MPRISKDPNELSKIAQELKPEIQERLNKEADQILRNARISAAAKNRKCFMTFSGARALAELMFFAEAFDER